MSSSSQTQYVNSVQNVIDSAVENFEQQTTIESWSYIPGTDRIPSTHKPNHWIQVDNVICVFVDMKNSTQLSAQHHPRSTAKIYQMFTDSAVRILHAFSPSYIDVRGDGAFALFEANKPNWALAAAVSFKSFATEVFKPKAETKKVSLDAHIGIDQGRILVRKIGMSPHGNRTDRQNEVWAGRPVNMASKLAAMGDFGQLMVSNRFYQRINNDWARMSCDCNGPTKLLWEEKDVAEDAKFDFSTAYLLTSRWCKVHGQEYCKQLMLLDAGK